MCIRDRVWGGGGEPFFRKVLLPLPNLISLLAHTQLGTVPAVPADVTPDAGRGVAFGADEHDAGIWAEPEGFTERREGGIAHDVIERAERCRAGLAGDDGGVAATCGGVEAVSYTHLMRQLGDWLAARNWSPRQVQCFIPTPGTVATAMYYARCTPDGAPIYVARTDEERRRQHEILLGRPSGQRPRTQGQGQGQGLSLIHI